MSYTQANVPRRCLKAGPCDIQGPDVFAEKPTSAALTQSDNLWCIGVFVEFQEFHTRSASICLFLLRQ